ncbi:MAG TPA: hypothetical protein VFX59_23420 [Polyangiales bacterium]|nr:hypothetical protein [Polyangiales bacterium]
MSAHLSWQALVDYWADDHPDPDAVELHTMGCAECTERSASVGAVARALGKLLPPLLTPGMLSALQARGLRIAQNVFAPGDRREVPFPVDLDVLIHRLEGLADDVVRLDFKMFVESTGAAITALDDVPFVQGAALLACQQHYASLPWDAVVELHATHRDGRKSQTRYTILHRFLQA